MPERVVIVAALITGHPLCIDCIAAKLGDDAAAAQATIARISKVLTVRTTVDRCRDCGTVGRVYALGAPGAGG